MEFNNKYVKKFISKNKIYKTKVGYSVNVNIFNQKIKVYSAGTLDDLENEILNSPEFRHKFNFDNKEYRLIRGLPPKKSKQKKNTNYRRVY